MLATNNNCSTPLAGALVTANAASVQARQRLVGLLLQQGMLDSYLRHNSFFTA
jgi:hypothetical protein